MAGQQVGVVVLHQAAHAHEQDLALQVEFRVLLKDAVVPDFAAGFVPDDQNLQGQKQEAVEDRLGAALTLGGPRLGDRGGSIKAGSCGPLR